jgi:hypothetical protein
LHHKWRPARRLTVEPSGSLRNAINSMRADLLTSQESTTLIPSKAVGGNTASRTSVQQGVDNDCDMEGDVDVADQKKPGIQQLL